MRSPINKQGTMKATERPDSWLVIQEQKRQHEYIECWLVTAREPDDSREEYPAGYYSKKGDAVKAAHRLGNSFVSMGKTMAQRKQVR